MTRRLNQARTPLPKFHSDREAADYFETHSVADVWDTKEIADPRLLTVADLEHGETEERWFSIGIARNGALVSVVYLWFEADPAVIKIRLISARRATQAERRKYEEGL
ncbi:MAG TPA: BrnT family toxin [Bryobacteraceae bacterium]|nr:BrnT family toxin [Bryobacteraceae bacterium]